MALTRPRAAQIYDIDYKQATRVVTVANITLSGGAPNQVDGVNLSLKDRVLVTGQSTASQNGIYYVTTLGSGSNGTWSRSLDTDVTGEILSGTIVMVTEGTIYADTQWKLTTNDPITVGVTDQTWVQNYSANSIASGNSNVVVLTNANVLLSSAGTANVVDVFGTGIKITGTESVTGNITGANIFTGGVVSATGNITGDYFLGNVFYANGITASKVYNGNSEVNVTSSGGNVNVSVGGTTNVALFTTTGEYVTGLLSVTGNVISGNVSTAGNVTANYFLGNVACASGIYATKIFNGNSEANIGTANGNANISIGGVSNIVVVTSAGILVTGITSTSGNVTGGNILTAGLVSATGNATAGNILTAGLFSATANITGGNILTSGLISATSNVTANNFIGNGNALTGINSFSTVAVTGQSDIVASGLNSTVTFAAGNNISLTTGANTITIAYSSSGSSSIFATGGDMGLISQAVTASEDLGDVVTLANISYDLGNLFNTVTYNQIDMTGFTSNVNTGNLNATGLVSAAGNVTGAYILGNVAFATGIPAGYGNANLANIGSNTISTTGNISSGNLLATGIMSSTGNATAGNILTAGLISATGTITTSGDYSLTGNIVDAGSLWINTSANGNITLNPNGSGQSFIATGLSVAGNIVSHAILETATITAAAPAAPTTFDIITSAVQYYTANANANVTVNFRGNATTTANALLAVGQSTTVALLWTNGATAYYPNVYQIDGSNVTPKWQGGTAVTAGNANSTDIYSFTIIKTAATPTYVVFASQTKFA